jgi:hypothetical protein
MTDAPLTDGYAAPRPLVSAERGSSKLDSPTYGCIRELRERALGRPYGYHRQRREASASSTVTLSFR